MRKFEASTRLPWLNFHACCPKKCSLNMAHSFGLVKPLRRMSSPFWALNYLSLYTRRAFRVIALGSLHFDQHVGAFTVSNYLVWSEFISGPTSFYECRVTQELGLEWETSQNPFLSTNRAPSLRRLCPQSPLELNVIQLHHRIGSKFNTRSIFMHKHP